MGIAAGLVSAEMPDFPDLLGRGSRRIFPQHGIEKHSRHSLIAHTFDFQKLRLKQQDLRIARRRIFFGLSLNFGKHLRGSKLPQVFQIPPVPGILHARVGGLRTSQEFFRVETRRNGRCMARSGTARG